MRNFLKIAENVDFLPLLHALQRQPELWNQNTIRTRHPGTAHSQVDDILVRFQDVTADHEKIADEHESLFYLSWNALPQLRSIVFDLMRWVEGVRLGRIIITRLAPGKRILPHVDGGTHAAYYDRYHLVLKNHPGSNFRAGEEQVFMRTGECWWFDNSKEHEVINNSAEDRIVVIIDVRTK